MHHCRDMVPEQRKISLIVTNLSTLDCMGCISDYRQAGIRISHSVPAVAAEPQAHTPYLGCLGIPSSHRSTPDIAVAHPG